MGTPFKIPKKKQPSDASVIRMTSPLSRLQDDVTTPSLWNRGAFNSRKSNTNGCVTGSRQAKPGPPKGDQWRPKRASDKLCQREDVKHTPAAKKQWGPGLSKERSTLQPEDDEDEEEHEKKTDSPVRETQNANSQACVEAGVSGKQNGQSTHSSPHTHTEDRMPAKLARTQKNPPVQKAAGRCLYTCRKLRPSIKTYQRIKASSAEPIVLSSGDEDEEEDKTQSDARLKSDLQKGKSAKGPKTDDGTGECVSVCVVPSELRAYGVWDATGSGLTPLTDSSSSHLFLALSDAQAVLLNTELLPLHKHTAAPPSPFVLVHLVGRLDDVQRATLASLMDVMAVRSGHTSLGRPLSREEGLTRVTCHRHGAHFLNLLGNKVANQESRNGTRNVKAPAVTSAITVTTEDLECLRDGEFLNDVIIDFYLKYLHLERADRDVAQRSHIFSSFFYKQLTRKANSSEEAGGTAAYRRHGRVRTWTRNVDIFSKDFLFIPVNQEPCILIMDSLKLSYHNRVYMLLQEYVCRTTSSQTNPIVHFDLPLRLERWFPRQQVRRKRAELRELVLQLYQAQVGGAVQSS
ncbi:Sentrin-specific protease 7 [Bagarius yarrelli]|uniref:Sentrin-specific protease 7 n=1 Tax=Bagarius yarrelli TaxID=175774 RepID=A0A556TU67_BAGYA|nr:Sentrin-specific protease 7 [Bagarius yarrelli]